MGIGNQGLGSWVGGGGGGGGGGTVIADGGTIGGAYEGNVTCDGDAYFDDDVTITGNLYATAGTLYNTGGHSLSVGGDAYTSVLQFPAAVTVTSVSLTNPAVLTTSAPHGFPEGSSGYNIALYDVVSGENTFDGLYEVVDVTAEDEITLSIDNTTGVLPGSGMVQRIALPVQGNITVAGDLFFQRIVWPQHGGSAATMNIGGNLIGASVEGNAVLNAAGAFDTNGAGLVVRGNVNAHTVNLSGGEAGGSDAGNGGSAVIYGDLNVYDWSATGGQMVRPLGASAGHGGNLTVWGTACISDDLRLNGGELSNAMGFNAGGGGDFTCYGTANVDDLYLFGGSMQNGTGDAGPSGTINIWGDLTVDTFRLYGGDCTTTNPSSSAGNGGDVTINGNATFQADVEMGAGARYGALLEAGIASPASGGSLKVYGNCTAIGDYEDEDEVQISVYGGDVFTTDFGCANGGDSGFVYVMGTLQTGFIRAHGGQSGFGFAAGSGGEILIGGDLVATSVLAYGPDNANGAGGFGGRVEVRGSASTRGIDTSGGNGTNGHGREGGSIEVWGVLVNSANDLNTSGGDCTSTDNTHDSGVGGVVEVKSLQAEGTQVLTNGGARSGATVAPYAGGAAPHGGSVTCKGPLVVAGIVTNGGSVSTDAPGPAGGAGGNIVVYGSCLAPLGLSVIGGNSAGANAGNSGDVSLIGSTVVGALNLNGGSANDSLAGGDAGTNGCMGHLVLIGGATLSVVTALDGTGAGAAPATARSLELAGNCTIGDLDVTDRVGVTIQPYVGFSTTLKVESFVSKGTLNDVAGAESANVSATAPGTLFISGVGASTALGWYAVQGADLFGP